MPDNFKQWVGTNSQRIADAKKRGTLPYFIRDNQNTVDGILTGTPQYDDYLINGVKQMHVLNGKDIRLTKIVSDSEADIRMNKRFETGVCVNANGEIIIDKRGTSNQVSFTQEECKLMKDCIFTHNHPSGWKYPENDICRIGNSFSIQDICLAISCDIAEMRAVTPNYTFSLKRPSRGWNINLQDFVEDYEKENRKLHTEFTDRINKGTLTIGQATSTYFHILCKRLAKKYGLDYHKLKTK